MVVMAAFVQFENRLAGFEVVALQQAGLLELGQHPIDGGQADIQSVGQQVAVDILGRDMARRAFFLQLVEEIENLQARIGRLEADALEVVGMGHGTVGAASGRWNGQL